MKPPLKDVSRRERQILEILYELGCAGVAEVKERLPDEVSYSGVRALLAIMEKKGLVRHAESGGRYLYEPTAPAAKAGRSALDQVLNVFFGGSVERAVAALLSRPERNLSDDEIARLELMLQEAKRNLK